MQCSSVLGTCRDIYCGALGQKKRTERRFSRDIKNSDVRKIRIEQMTINVEMSAPALWLTTKMLRKENTLPKGGECRRSKS